MPVHLGIVSRNAVVVMDEQTGHNQRQHSRDAHRATTEFRIGPPRRAFFGSFLPRGFDAV